jgi:hypothetical protein
VTWFAIQSLAVAGWPTGALSESEGGARLPLSRSDSILFRTARVDLGADVALSPAFVEVGPRALIEPIAVLDVGLGASVVDYFSPRWGTMGFSGPSGTLDTERAPRWREDGFATTGWSVEASPTGQGQVGPVVFFSSWTLTSLHLKRPAGMDDPYVFEPFRGLVIAWDDLVVEHLSAVLWQPLDGEDGRALLRVGVAERGHWSVNLDGNGSLAVGLAGMGHPAHLAAVPTVTAVLLPYLTDPDRVGGAPFVAVLAGWER